jgi:hypothetical protein
MAIAHYFSLKIPVLFVYYDTSFYAYQDKIISFAVCAYIALFYSASQHRSVALNAIIVLALTVTGLSSINFSKALASVMNEGQSTFPYWLQTGLIAFYLVILVALYIKDGKNRDREQPHGYLLPHHPGIRISYQGGSADQEG